ETGACTTQPRMSVTAEATGAVSMTGIKSRVAPGGLVKGQEPGRLPGGVDSSTHSGPLPREAALALVGEVGLENFPQQISGAKDDSERYDEHVSLQYGCSPACEGRLEQTY